MSAKSMILEKLKEATVSVLPISLIVLVLSLSVVPIGTDVMMAFLIGTVMLIIGMGLFNLGAEMSMTQIGSLIGARMTKSRKLWLILLLSFLLGVAITVAEPDLQVLASNAPHIDTQVLIVTVSVGVGVFLSICMARIVLSVPLRWLLLFFYGAVFVLAAFTDVNFLSIAFDAGGVTTGPMTVPFIMALGVGVASIRTDEKAKSDSFGLVALCSVGPILTVLILGFIFKGNATEVADTVVASYANTVEIGRGYLAALPHVMLEVAGALAPIIGFFFLFQIIAFRLSRRPLLRILIGLIYTYVGLVLFLSGVNVGFSSLGYLLGEEIVGGPLKLLLIPLAMLIGWFVTKAEPAVAVLNKQVEDISAGAISARAMGVSLSVAISAAMGMAMLRVVSGIPILYFLVPGYAIALLLSFLVPPTFTAIAFDSGGVVSGPMTATFMLPLAMGACAASGGSVITDAFGLVALVAMMPLITVQVMGAVSVIRTRTRKTPEFIPEYTDHDIIELWEVA